MQVFFTFLLLLHISHQNPEINPFAYCRERIFNNYCDLECEDEFLPTGDCDLHKPPTIIRDVNLTINKLPLVFASRQKYTVLQWRIQHKARIHILTDVSKISIPSNFFDRQKDSSEDFNFRILVRFESRSSEESSPLKIKEALESSLMNADQTELERMRKTSEELRVLIVILFLTMLCTLAAVLVLLRTRRRRSVCAPVWIPPMEEEPKKMPKFFATASSITYDRTVTEYDYLPYNETENCIQKPGKPQKHISYRIPQLLEVPQRTPIHWIVENNDPQLQMVEKLQQIEECVNNGVNVNAQDESEETALILAVRCQRHAMVSKLLSLGADATIMNSNNSTCLHQAVHNVDVEMMQILLSHPTLANTVVDGRRSIDAVDATDRTPLMVCADNVLTTKLIRMLLESGADPSDSGDKEAIGYTGMTALHHAAQAGNLPMIHILLNIRAVKINAYDQQGATPLWHAVNSGHYLCVEALLSAGGDMYSPDHLERLPTDVARSKAFMEIETLLLNHERQRKEKNRQPPAKRKPVTASDSEEGSPVRLISHSECSVPIGSYDSPPSNRSGNYWSTSPSSDEFKENIYSQIQKPTETFYKTETSSYFPKPLMPYEEMQFYAQTKTYNQWICQDLV